MPFLWPQGPPRPAHARLGAVLRFFFFNDTATTEIYTLSLHDALPIYFRSQRAIAALGAKQDGVIRHYGLRRDGDRKSTRLNSSHDQISYAVFCLKKKKQQGHNEAMALRGVRVISVRSMGLQLRISCNN